MALVIWPAELPQRVLLSGMSKRLADPRIQSQMTTGPNKVRRRTSSTPETFTGSIIVTRPYSARFERFWNEETANGALPFRMPSQTGDGWPILTEDFETLLTEDGVPILTTSYWLCMFADAPQMTRAGDAFNWSFNLNIMP